MAPRPAAATFRPSAFRDDRRHARARYRRALDRGGPGGARPLARLAQFRRALSANGAGARYVPLDGGEAWRLDPERLAAAVGPATRAILFNSPANPTGYVATEAELIAVLKLARARDLWIVADEIYGRLTYGGRARPRFTTSCGLTTNPVRADVLEELGDDGLADRMAGGAAGPWAPRSKISFNTPLRAYRSPLSAERPRRSRRANPSSPFSREPARPARHRRRRPRRDRAGSLRASRGRLLPLRRGRRRTDSRRLALRLVDEAGSAWRRARLSVSAARAICGYVSRARPMKWPRRPAALRVGSRGKYA